MPTITEQKLKQLVKDGVREVLSAEIMKLRALALPEIAEKEQREIERLYKKPSRRIAKTVDVRI